MYRWLLLRRRVCEVSLLTTMSSSTSTMSSPKVHLSPATSLLGKISYTKEKRRPVYAFLGVRYGHAPKRFQPPQRLVLPEGEIKAKSFGPICPQDTSFLEKGPLPAKFPTKREEDCLFLNVWSPTLDPQAKLPVMVFIHGGAFVSGMGNMYQGTSLCSFHNVVVVSINYRLGPFGFLCTGDDVARGNYGLLDQIEALHWVQHYITAFGGDKENVTIFGESAGAMSVSMLLLSPLCRGLFHRAISQSGTAALMGIPSPNHVAGRRLRSTLSKKGHEIRDSKEIVAFMESQTTDWIVKNLGDSFSAMTGNGFAMSPVIDGHVIPSTAGQVYKQGGQHKVPYILGINSHEGALFTIPVIRLMGVTLETKSELMGYLDAVASRLVKTGSKEVCKEEIYEEYFANRMSKGEDGIMEGLVEFFGDLTFTPSTGIIADWHSESSPTYTYLFEHAPAFSPYPEYVKADHGMDIVYVFGLPFANLDFLQFSDDDRNLSQLWMKYFVNFATTGDPNSSELPRWPQYRQSARSTLHLKPAPEVLSALKPGRMRFWQRLQTVYRAKEAKGEAKL